MGIVYGAADVAEDLKLASILDDWRRRPRHHGVAPEAVDMDGGEAAAANALTRIKLVTICLSVAGALAFAVLSSLARLIYPPPGDPEPAPPVPTEPIRT
jgi:hypothetical protein